VPENPALLVYDADCSFCTGAAAWLQARWSSGEALAVGAACLSDDVLLAHGLRRHEAEAAVCWLEAGEACQGHRAIAAALRRAGGCLALAGRLLELRPLERPAAAAYRLVARHRHRLPSATAACRAAAISSRG
jgi:predicted DCC family thiol-disulfide oxidoreductase YuxK